MEDWTLILSLAGIGFGLMLLEIFLPGMVVGSLGLLSCIASVVVAFTRLGVLSGLLVFLVESVLIMGGFVAWMNIFPRTPWGRHMLLQDKSPAGGSTTKVRTGQTGLAATDLRPAGVAELDGQRFDVVSENAFVSAGDPIKVVRADAFRILVRRIEP